MKQLSMEKMVEHMLKFFLIFNLSFMFIDPVLGQIRNDQKKKISTDTTSLWYLLIFSSSDHFLFDLKPGQ